MTWTEHALSKLSEAGYRRGRSRSAVVEMLGRQSCAVSARDIDDALRAAGQSRGRAGLYRTSGRPAGLTPVQRLDLGSGEKPPEPHLPGGEHHHHLVCDYCGSVQPFEDPDLEGVLERLSSKVDYTVDE